LRCEFPLVPKGERFLVILAVNLGMPKWQEEVKEIAVLPIFR
jgi:hypothetical protein